MATEYTIDSDGTLTITMKIKPAGSMLEQEDQIAVAVAEAGRLATIFSLKGFDTEGQSLVHANEKYTSRGQGKKVGSCSLPAGSEAVTASHRLTMGAAQPNGNMSQKVIKRRTEKLK